MGEGIFEVPISLTPSLQGMKKGSQTFGYRFNEVGEFPYFCTVHPQFMKAVVKVAKK
jgi:plastocyanin